MRYQCARFFAVFLCAIAIGAEPLSVLAATSTDREAQLQAQLDQLNGQIAQNQAKLAIERNQRATLENQVAILDSQIREAQLEIAQRNLAIQQVQDQIAKTQAGIAVLDGKVSAGQASLAQIIRDTAEINRTPLAIKILGGTLQDAFNDIDDFATLQKALADSFTQFKTQKLDLSQREVALENQQQEEQQLLQVQILQQNAQKTIEQQKQNLVIATRGQESIYQQLIVSQQQTAAQIKAQLFSLNNSNHTASFGDMYQYAKEAQSATGVDAAFTLAILTEESNLGQNVGNCSYQTAMSPRRDIPDYLQIMQGLGLDPDSQKVSCAQSYGAYGGAMGPAQFIPSTWVLYQDRIAKASGQNPPNPWDPRTATFATAIYMADLGAGAGTAASERVAALKYLGGSHWQNPSLAFYWESVQSYMQKYQQNIAVLNGN